MPPASSTPDRHDSIGPCPIPGGLTSFFLLLAATLFLGQPVALLGAQQESDGLAPPRVHAQLDSIFAEFSDASSPGCAAGIAHGNEVRLTRAWGMADLEHGIANRPGTIFEAGSVSKQFTAAAILLLAEDGLLSLDDDIRSHVPEVPDYGDLITLRHLMTHTSGLRDWGSVAALAGWGRSTRTHDHDHVLDILSRQSGLNFEPGDQYSYSNSGYNLLAIVVERVSGESLQAFSENRIFQPLGLVDTQWRDDYRRVVPGRASAYSPTGSRGPDGAPGWRINRPIEHVYGNGGLLTTVADLLRWNHALDTQAMGANVTQLMHEQGILNNGEVITYAGGLMVGHFEGIPSVTHTGATAGYRAYLGRFPDQAISVAVLCNTTSASPGGLGGAVARRALEAVDPEAVETAQIRLQNEADAEAAAQPAAPTLPTSDEDPEPEFSPSTEELEAFAGRFFSPDAEASVELRVAEGALVLQRRPATQMRLTPLVDQPDTFQSGLGTLTFHRDTEGRVIEFGVRQARVFDLRFQRTDPVDPGQP